MNLFSSGSADRLSLDVAPLLPWPLLAVMAGLAVVFLLLLLWRGKKGAWLRAVATLLLLLALLDPRLVQEKREALSDIVAVVVDRSGSQDLANRKAETDAALEGVQERLKARPNTEIRLVESYERDGAADGTRLIEAITSAVRDIPAERLAGIITITDGVVHDIPPDGTGLPFTAPLHALITGNAREVDRRIDLIEAPRFGLVGREITVTLRIESQGMVAQPVPVTIRQNGAVLGTRMAQPGVPLTLPIKVDRAGQNLFEFSIPAVPGELTALNNIVALPIDGVREKLRVLLVSGEPHAGERTWRNLLKADPNVDLVHFTILRPPEKQDSTPTNELALIAFPTRELFVTKIREFDLIIFDRYSNQTFLPTLFFENMVRYVREGGAMLFAVGPEFVARNGLLTTPLRDILPAEPTGEIIERAFQAQVTPLGQRHPVTRKLEGAGGLATLSAATPSALASQPRWAPWFRQVVARPREGQDLMRGVDGLPLLMLKREGRGRVGLFLSDHVWLWARGYQGGGPYLDLLRRLSHWLMKEPELEEEALRLSVQGSRLQVERRSIGDAPGDARLTNPAGETLPVTLNEVEPGLWQAELAIRRAGLHRVEQGGLVAFAHVGPPNPREFRNVISSPERLRVMVESTGGSVRRIADSGAVSLPRIIDIRSGNRFAGADYIALKPTQASILKGISVLPLGLGFLALGLLLLPLLLVWFVEGAKRRRAG